MKNKPFHGKKTTTEVLQQLQRYCAYQDRCHQEVNEKLQELGVWGQEAGEIVVALIEEKFLDEERFARAFVRGKYRQKKWGRRKIVQALAQKNISPYCQKAGLSEIEEAEYLKNLRELLQSKFDRTAGDNDFELKAKMATFAIGKGYEPDLVWEIVSTFF
jgi:regulatory protein